MKKKTQNNCKKQEDKQANKQIIKQKTVGS